MEVFSNYAKYYNLLYRDKDYQAEVNYITDLINKFPVIEVKTILDIGCGTGKHDYIFAEKGYTVSGIDFSQEMIAIARQNTPQHLQNTLSFIEADVRNVKLNQLFDVVVSLFHVASYQTSNDDLNNFFKTAYDHLKPGGLFIFDFWYGPAVLTDLPVVRVKRLENEELKITRIAEPLMHYEKNMVDVNYEIIIESRKTGKIDKINETHKMRYLFLPELEVLTSQIGYKIINVFEWLSNKNKIKTSSWYGVMVLQKV